MESILDSKPQGNVAGHLHTEKRVQLTFELIV